jgi:hypothetical protein
MFLGTVQYTCEASWGLLRCMPCDFHASSGSVEKKPPRSRSAPLEYTSLVTLGLETCIAGLTWYKSSPASSGNGESASKVHTFAPGQGAVLYLRRPDVRPGTDQESPSGNRAEALAIDSGEPK